ncbi:piggyBac transposable element-derived protein 4-like [Myripristis murdjan]|uniref:piggyBac transposable element-derived protein 4-like n=1 Tax=Myripristis murdjan TaxID=586833 RepID=UPI001175EBB6|nr:piggyBac transposable element-derived protein 4-like [Myripristis murdjan]
MWVSAVQKMWVPRSDVCVDEMLIGFRGRCPFRQNMPSKPDRYGLKVWVPCECETSYCWNLQFYLGKPSSAAKREEGLGTRVVMDLTAGLTGTVTTDNFFTSHDLGQQLLGRGMALVGTLRKRRHEIPPQLLQMRAREVRSTIFGFTKDIMICSYVPKERKTVVLLSTKHRQPVVSEAAHNKPQVILDYNRCKGAVDNLDKVCLTHFIEGDFILYMDALTKLVPWFFALDHTNYARWIPVHLRNMITLKDTHPDALSQFLKGNFVVKKTTHSFSAIAIDQAHKQNNASVKGDGGAMGLTENHAALQCWMVSGSEMARVVGESEASTEKRKVTDTRHYEQTKHEQIYSGSC